MATEPDFDTRWHASAHLMYELDQLASMYVVLARLEYGEINCDEEVGETLRLATLEALLVHARCVIEFLVGRPRKDGTRARKAEDIPPTWFASGWTTTPGPNRLDRWLDLLDGNISHLSTKRIRLDDLGSHDAVDWGSEMFREIADELDRFVAAVDEAGSQDAMGEHVRRLKSGIAEYPSLETGS